jgi:large subunit ribosomal protein L19
MARSYKFKDEIFNVGDTISVSYRIKEGQKERIQKFVGILISIKGNSLENRMITVRKVSKSGIGVERIFPLSSPFILGIKKIRKSSSTRSKIFYIRNLSQQELKAKIYRQK